jgi:hypothetical protein
VQTRSVVLVVDPEAAAGDRGYSHQKILGEAAEAGKIRPPPDRSQIAVNL